MCSLKFFNISPYKYYQHLISSKRNEKWCNWVMTYQKHLSALGMKNNAVVSFLYSSLKFFLWQSDVSEIFFLYQNSTHCYSTDVLKIGLLQVNQQWNSLAKLKQTWLKNYQKVLGPSKPQNSEIYSYNCFRHISITYQLTVKIPVHYITFT